MAYLHKPLHFLIFINLLFLICLPPPSTDADTVSFNFPSFGANQTDIEFKGDARYFGTSSSIYLTHLKPNSTGRAMHRQPIQLWLVDGGTTRFADFTTRFSFTISKIADYANAGEGLTFLIVSDNATWTPNGDVGQLLGLFESEALARSGAAGNQVVAVEFDNAQNEWDPSESHVGIDINSIESVTYRNVVDGFADRGIVDALVTYDSATKNLSAFVTFELGSLSYNVSHIIDLSTVLPPRIRVGFSAATSSFVEIHELRSWSFDSSINGTGINRTGPDVPGPNNPPGRKKTLVWVVGSTAGLVVYVIISGVALYCLICKRNMIPVEEPLVPSSVEGRQVPSGLVLVDDVGPKMFSYHELFEATSSFSDELKLGSGGFGDVYEGNLPSSNKRVAIKKFRNGSTQGESEYVSEVNIISRLKHRNLVQLEGWCHEKNELLLVYEFMPNGSLDLHLFSQNNFPLLTWPARYNIALGLASAMNYLQNESNHCVVHRDIKSSNIMLDQDFNAKLGDFGLARLTDHGRSFNPTDPAGTRGYQAPELVIRWESPTKASDVYSFGVVALELATGKRAILSRNTSLYSLVDWVWDKHTKDAILEEALDGRVKNSADLDEAEARRLVMIGLACCHPDASQRPLIEQVKDMLKSMAVNAPDVPRVKPELAGASPRMRT